MDSSAVTRFRRFAALVALFLSCGAQAQVAPSWHPDEAGIAAFAGPAVSACVAYYAPSYPQAQCISERCEGPCQLWAGYPSTAVGTNTTSVGVRLLGGGPYPSGSMWSSTPKPYIYGCPPNSTLQGGVCICDAGMGASGGSCVPAAQCLKKKDKPAGYWRWDTSSATSEPVQYFCDAVPETDGMYCVVKAQKDIGYKTSDTQWQMAGPGVYTGEGTTNCTGSGDSASSPAGASAPGTAPAGESGTKDGATETCAGFLGEVNGVTTCIPRSEATGVDWSTSKTTTSTTATGTSTETVTKEVTCTASDCVTKTTTTTGTGTTVTTTKQSTADFCKDNPKEKACGGTGTAEGGGGGEAPGSFAGACGGVSGAFSCSGDAVECAIARAINEAKCLLTPSDEILVVAEQMKNGTFASSIPSTTVTLGEFNQDNPFSASCPGDVPFTLMGMTASIPLSEHCSALQMLGNVLVAFTLFAATVFVIRGFS